MTAVPRMFEDDVNPTDDEIRRWAYSGALEPMQDFDIIIADPEHLPTLINLVSDMGCHRHEYLLGSGPARLAAYLGAAATAKVVPLRRASAG
jgi:hypothetical protein